MDEGKNSYSKGTKTRFIKRIDILGRFSTEGRKMNAGSPTPLW